MTTTSPRSVVAVVLNGEPHPAIVLQIEETSAIVAVGTSRYRLNAGLTIQPRTIEATALGLEKTTYFYNTGISAVEIGTLHTWRGQERRCRPDIYNTLYELALKYGRLVIRESLDSSDPAAVSAHQTNRPR